MGVRLQSIVRVCCPAWDAECFVAVLMTSCGLGDPFAEFILVVRSGADSCCE
jgi:hypothetical protein